MKKLTFAIASVSLALCSLSVQAETPAAAKAMLDEAVALFKAKGKDGALKDINAGGKWTKGTLYVVVAQYDGLMVGHSANDKVPGKNMLEAKDAAGTPFVKQTIANVKSTGNSALDLRWGNPVTKQIADATMFAKAVPGQDLYVGAVVFK
jgi:cytochrome c